MNSMVKKVSDQVVNKDIHIEDQQYIDSMNLFYVACSRAEKSLLNASALGIETDLVKLCSVQSQ